MGRPAGRGFERRWSQFDERVSGGAVGAGVAGAAVGAVAFRSPGAAVAGGLIAGIGSVIVDSSVHNVTYSIITDVKNFGGLCICNSFNFHKSLSIYLIKFEMIYIYAAAPQSLERNQYFMHRFEQSRCFIFFVFLSNNYFRM